jgi:hypothetical protein
LFDYRDTPGSLFRSACAQRPELIRRLVENHEDTFRNHVVDVIYAIELERQAEVRLLRDQIEQERRIALSSTAYRLGAMLLAPVHWLLRLLKRPRVSRESTTV